MVSMSKMQWNPQKVLEIIKELFMVVIRSVYNKTQLQGAVGNCNKM